MKCDLWPCGLLDAMDENCGIWSIEVMRLRENLEERGGCPSLCRWCVCAVRSGRFVQKRARPVENQQARVWMNKIRKMRV